jgi:thiosulfate dehydrogenase [quinone] large subunit
MLIQKSPSVVHVDLVGPAWWITYIVIPLTSVAIALFTAFITHRFTLREQDKQLRIEQRNNERQSQVNQNGKLESLIMMLDFAKATLDNTAPGAQPPSIPLTSLIDLGTKCELGDVLGDLTRAGTAYDSVRQRWNAGDASISAEVQALARSVKEALTPITAVAQSTLNNGRARLDQLDLPDSKATGGPSLNGSRKTVVLDANGHVIVTRAAANVAVLLRLGLGLLYLGAFISRGFGVLYSNSTTNAAGKVVSYGWHFSYNTSMGWISSGFTHSPTAAFISSTHGPLAAIAQNLPKSVDNFGWMFALAGLSIALILGICMRIAAWGGFLLNIIIWFSLLPPAGNPVIDGKHMAFAFSLLLLAFLHAGNRFGFGCWWETHTPALIH